jgi:hypothetical protein
MRKHKPDRLRELGVVIPLQNDADYIAICEGILARDEKKFARCGDGLLLLSVLEMCGRVGLKIPQWAATAFTELFNKVFWADVGSWDEAFGPAYPKGMHLAKARLRFNIDLYLRVQELLDWRPGDPPAAEWLTEPAVIGEWLFEEVGKEFGLGKTACSKRYYEEKRRLKEG